MPIIFIVIGIGTLLGVGGYFLRPEDAIQTSNVATTTVEDKNETVVVPDPNTTASSPEIQNNTYADGQHTVTTNYIAPGNANHTVTVAFTLNDDKITSSAITYGGDSVEVSSGFQKKFTESYETEVIGKKIDDIKLSRVGGASLTTAAFNDAIAKLKIEAKI